MTTRLIAITVQLIFFTVTPQKLLDIQTFTADDTSHLQTEQDTMFAPRTTTFSKQTNSFLSNNENATFVTSDKTSKATVSSMTPKTKRRAFGDISNKKLLHGKGNNSNNNVALKKTTFTPRSKLQHYQKQSSGIPKPTTLIQSLASTQNNKLLPSRTNPITSFKNTIDHEVRISIEPKVKSAVPLEPVEDVELPAGRLFSEQSKDETDDWSDFSEEEIISNKGMWDDWRESVRQKYEEERKMDSKLDFEMKQKMESIIQQELGTFDA